MKRTILLFTYLLIFCTWNSFAQKGKDGARTITVNNSIVNEYTTLTANAATGNTTLKVNNSSLNTNNRFAGALANGDLIMIIQIQGAAITGTPNDKTWGAVSNYGTCGEYEFLEVSNVPDANTINVKCSVKNNYTASGKVEVVRVPRLSSLTINANDTVICDTWNGTTGGILSIEISGNTVINAGGAINASAKGFRGGTANIANGADRVFGYVSTNISDGGEKGESIAGYQSDYIVYGGQFDRGAPANGGGGGNAWNAAGGGGANAGDINKWNGEGNPDITNTTWIAAWNLEYNGFANSTSSGGGRGGYAVAERVQDPLTLGPNNVAWDPRFFRDSVGGIGGRPLDYSTGRLFFGGGGGSGHEDNGFGAAGGKGGGIIYIISDGTISGSGTVMANGENGHDDVSNNNSGDGVGGAGGGGVVMLNSTGSITGLSAYANGGHGGNQFITIIEAEGPGGGGGGGYIAISNGTITNQVAGGANGTTNCTLMTTFPADGATSGGAGEIITNLGPITFSLVADAGKDVTICNGQSTALYGTGGDSTITTYSWEPASSLINANTTHPIASPTITTTYTLTATSTSCPGKDSMIVNVVPKIIISPLADTAICSGNAAALNPNGSSAYTYSWNPPAGLSCTNCSNPSATPAVATTYTVIATNQYCRDTAQSIVSIALSPTLTLTDTTICYGQLTSLYPVSNGTLAWTPATNLSCTDCVSPILTPLTNQTYTITATFGNCTITDSLKITVDQPVVFTGPAETIYSGAAVSLQASGVQKYIWSPSNTLSSDTAANPIASPLITTTYSVIGFDALGCSASADEVVIVTDPCQLPAVPNAFSPNGDGSNDIFRMLNPYADKLNIFSVYNRWGQLVYQTTELNQGWNGEFNGQPEPVGTYVYYIEIVCHGETISYKGNVTLLR